MTQFKRILNWFVTTAVFDAALYFGLVHGIQGAANIAQFYIWLTFLFSWLALSDNAVRDAQNRGLPGLPEWVFGLQNITVLAALLWYGWIWCAVAWLVKSILASRFRRPLPAADAVKATV